VLLSVVGRWLSTDPPAPQSRTVTLTVASGNLSCPATATLTIPPLAPVTCADINATLGLISNTTGPTANTVAISTGWSGPGTATVNWGDGSAATTLGSPNPSLTHSYTRTAVDQTFTIALTVTQDRTSCPQVITVAILKLPT